MTCATAVRWRRVAGRFGGFAKAAERTDDWPSLGGGAEQEVRDLPGHILGPSMVRRERDTMPWSRWSFQQVTQNCEPSSSRRWIQRRPQAAACQVQPLVRTQVLIGEQRTRRRSDCHFAHCAGPQGFGGVLPASKTRSESLERLLPRTLSWVLRARRLAAVVQLVPAEVKSCTSRVRRGRSGGWCRQTNEVDVASGDG